METIEQTNDRLAKIKRHERVTTLAMVLAKADAAAGGRRPERLAPTEWARSIWDAAEAFVAEGERRTR